MGEKSIDLELVRRIQNGEKAAFDLLVIKYQHKIGNLISRYIKDAHEVQDVTQEAFIKAYRGLKNFRGDSAFYTWLYRIATNTAKNHLVSRGRHTPSNAVDPEEAEQYDTGSALREYATPERNLLAGEIGQVIAQCIESLPDDLKQAISLRELEGLSYEEIADVMNCPIGTVRSRIFRARDAVNKKLEPLIDETRSELS